MVGEEEEEEKGVLSARIRVERALPSRNKKKKDRHEKKEEVYLNSAGGRDGNLLASLAAGRSELLNSLDNVRSLNDLAEDDVGTVEPAGDDSGDEELRTVGVLSGVGHGEEEWLLVLQLEVLICKLLSVD